MGTLFSQQPREYRRVSSDDLSRAIRTMKVVAKEEGLDFSTVLAVAVLLEKRRALDLRVADCDAKDEQLAGFGEILKSAFSTE